MASIIGNTVSALLANQLRVANAASNIANAGSPNYTPKDVRQTTTDAGSVSAQLVDRTPAKLTTLNANGEHEELPNVDFAQEVVTAQAATYDFKANATLLKTERDLQRKLVDILA